MKFFTLILLIFQIYSSFSYGALKYGEYTVALSKAKTDYFTRSKASDFWSLIPYYTGQENDSSCSAAALTTVLNGARRVEDLSQEEELITHKSLIEKYTDDQYRYNVCGDPALALQHGVTRLGVSVARLAEVLDTALAKLKLVNKKTKVEIVTIDHKNLEKSKKRFVQLLEQNEKSRDDFLILNFTQGILTGDGAGMIGHIAPVGAYDAKNKKVLILDPDRKWYEPYWSPVDKVFEAIADKNSDPRPGYIYLRLK